MDKTGAAALFYRGPRQQYSADRCLIRPFMVGGNPQELIFHVPDHPPGIEAIRLNLLARKPEIRIAYIKLFSLCVDILDKKTHKTASLLAMHNDADIREYCVLSGLACNNTLLGDLHVVDDEDPSIEFRILQSPLTGPQADLVAKVSLEYLPGEGYILARDQFLVQQEQMTHHIRSLESDLDALEKIKKEFENHQQSPLWVNFLRARTFHDKLTQWQRSGAVNSCLKLFQPAWWSRLKLTGYERWREANGYRNRNKK